MSDVGTILIVDDEPIGSMLLKELLQNAGYTCQTASSGSEALAAAARVQPDLVLLDVMMNDMDGFEVCRRLRATPHLAEMPIILVTALDDRDSRIHGFEAGADDFLSKPVNLTELRARVRTITRLNRYRRLLAERARFDRLIELSPDGIVIVDAAGSIHLVNRAIMHMLHLAQETAIIQHHLRVFVAPEYADHCMACLQHVLQDASQVARVEMALQRADGSSVPVEIKMGHFLWEGQPLVQMIVRDISERRQSTEELQQAHRVAEERAARFRLLVEMGRDMVSAPRLHTLLSLALERAIAFSGYDGGSILLLDAASGQMQVCASCGIDAVPPGTPVDDLEMSISGQVLRQQQALVLEGAGDTIGTHWRSYTRPIPATICLPLVAASGDSIGVLALKSSTRPHHLSSDDLDALHLFASQLAVMIERSRLHEENMHLLHELAERERRLQDLVEKLLVSQEEERRRVAYELHDGLAQVASGAYQHLQTFASHYRPRAARNRQELEQVLELAQRVVKEARMVIAGLRPTVLDDFGLASALRLEVEQRRADGWHISYDETPPPQRLPPAIETALFRIAQEALTNIRKHARTTRAHLALHCDAQAIRLEVRDWGCGFDAARLAASQAGEHIGLLGMQERASLLGGTLRIESQPDAGTRVLVEAPLPAPLSIGSRAESEQL